MDVLKGLSAEQISKRVLYVLLTLIFVSFLLFFFVGYSRSYDDNPSFTDPLFTDLVIFLLFFFIFLVVCVSLFAIYWTLHRRGKTEKKENNIPVKIISYTITTSLFTCFLLTFMLGGKSAIFVNGKIYNDVFWLKISDMFILTGYCMVAVIVSVIAYGATRYMRKER